MDHEFKKAGKIIDEIVTHLLRKGHRELNVDLKLNNNESIFTIKLERVDDDLLKLLDETLNQERDLSIEEYGWELMGESDFSSELNLVGMCLDEFRILKNDDYTEFMLIRNNRVDN